MTPQDLAICTGARIDRATEHLPHIEAAMQEFGIDTPRRQAAFLARVGHESGGLHWLVELWGPTAAQRRYEVRQDLGNNQPGDGFRFRGRGLIQLTGRDNYVRAGKALGVDLVTSPELLGTSPLAQRSAAWFWHSNNINHYADINDFDGVCDKINRGRKTEAYGDSNGWADSLALWKKALTILGAAP